VQVDLGAVAFLDLVDDRGGRRDQVQVELAAQALLDDLQMQQAQESAAEAEAQGGAQVLEIGGIDQPIAS